MMFILVTVALLLSFVAILRMQGAGELQRVLADLRSKNLIYLPADFAKLAPPVDEERQERAWAHQQRILKEKWPEAKFTHGLLRYSLKPAVRADQQLADDSQVERLAWRNLYSEGPLLLTGFGWMNRDFPRPEEVGIAQASSLRVSNLLAIRGLAQALAAAALVATDPRPELTDLDALVSALEPGCTLIDTFVLANAATFRDHAWLEATSRGFDPTVWIARPSLVHQSMITGFSGERAWAVGGLHQDFLRGRNFGEAISPRFGGWTGRFLWSAVATHDLAFSFRVQGDFEERLRGKPVDLQTLQRQLQANYWLHPLSSILIPSLLESGFSDIQFDTTARRLRLAAAVMRAFQQSKQLPADTAAVRALLPSDLFAANGDQPAILYTVIAPGRFRLWTDPATPATDLLPAGRIDTPTPTTAAYAEGKWWLEIDMLQLPAP